jgi:NitT/TauT family transport system ATP-binding protein
MKIILHAPTASALARARSNLRNLRRAELAAEIRLIANADAVPAALEQPDPDTDGHLFLCQNSLHSRDLAAPAGIATVPAAVQEIARLQAEGWIYIRA